MTVRTAIGLAGWCGAVGTALLAWQSGRAPTYSEDIRPILREKCVTCHRHGGAAPFPLVSYDQARRRAELIKRMAMLGHMPPCYSSTDFGEFCKAAPLTDLEVVEIQRWARVGAPEGQPSEPILTDSSKWSYGEPDVVLSVAPECTVLAEGGNYWRAFLVPLKDAAGKRLQAFDVIPEHPQVVRHTLVAIAKPGLEGTSAYAGDLSRETDSSLRLDYAKLIGSWAPGYRSWRLPEDVAFTLPKSGHLLVQVQYIPIGRPLPGELKLGLYFADEGETTEATWLRLGRASFAIPPNQAYTLSDETTLQQDTRILSIVPEAKFEARAIEVFAHMPGDETKRLFYTYNWRPYWPGNYQWQRPVTLPAGTRIVSEITYGTRAHSAANALDRATPILGAPSEGEELFWTHILTAPAE